ncbi:LRR repeats and ubiquitin-like domain-containing protein At2g30105 [Salvia splendens]|uniref:LRR repeats and ubiquitin-like domain-containing protein At2g30105 n=1 Tax=Salvia splendens TaxID=180675 RepID=UPI001C276113|nr:LRR repeats and ubiquitin-like domain-containing protein At2g30105 [Salvia splendens]
MDSEAATAAETSKVRLSVKFGGRSIPVEIAADATVKDLKLLLQTLTDVLPRGQKLICKGKVLSEDSSLASADISDRSKIMLIASQGLHQGGGPIKKELPTARAAGGFATEKRKTNEETVTKSRLERWKLSGVLALSDCGLTTIPKDAWTCGSSARVLDVSHNSLHEVPAEIGGLSKMKKLLLDSNLLSDTSIAWDELASLKHLIFLSLNQNNLTSIPSALGALTTLKHLDITNNKLVCIPTELGLLTSLEVLKLKNNRLKTIPMSIGDCVSLVDIDLSCNLLSELPETFGNLKSLKALCLSNNGLTTLPKTLFRLCIELSTLDLHGTEITIDLLRQFEGWEKFDERRRLKHQKQLDFRVDGSGDFDEGADKNW